MIFTKTELKDAYLIDIKKLEDQRGFFARGWCQKEFEEIGLVSKIAQMNISHNKIRGTLRGMHYQIPPYEETKLVRCTRGAIYDVIIDLRPDSPTFMQWIGVEMSANSYKMLYVPESFAHGFLTLEDDTEVIYQVSEFYTPQAEQGLRFDDPMFQIDWPLAVDVISEKDRSWEDFEVQTLKSGVKG